VSFATIKSAFKIVLLSGSLLTSAQLYAAEPVAPLPANGTTAPEVVKPAKKHKGHRRHKNHNKKHKGKKHANAPLSPEKQAEKTVEDCKKLLGAPVPEHESKRKAKKRKRCEDLISKEGIAITAADATPNDLSTKVPAEDGQSTAPVEAPASETATATPADAAAPSVAAAPEGDAPAPAEEGSAPQEAAPVEEATA